MNTMTKETLAEDLDHEARMDKGITLQVADLVYRVGDGHQELGHVAMPVGAGWYVAWPRGKKALHLSVDLVLVAA